MLLPKYCKQTKKTLPRAIRSMHAEGWDMYASVEPKNLIGVLFFLKSNSWSRFQVLTDITAYDRLSGRARFTLVYNLLSLKYNSRIFVRVFLKEGEWMPSITSIFPSANWMEREVWDLLGIFFGGHPDLRRILTDYGFEGHPLRKDFPLTGFTETRYDVGHGRIVYEPVELAQEYRDFVFSNPWKS